MKFRTKAIIGGVASAAVAAGASAVIVDGNKHLTVAEHTVTLRDLPASFDGMRVLHLSDLHGASFGNDQQRLLKLIDSLNVDAAFITGDLVDRRRTKCDKDMRAAIVLLKKLSERMPVVRVDGNHESRCEAAPRFQYLADRSGAQNVTGRSITIRKGNDRLCVVGVPDVVTFEYDEDAWRRSMRSLRTAAKHDFCIALSHRPQYMPDYVKEGWPLVLCGHAHGGQVRLPFVGGLYAPEQGVLPKYTAGLHTVDGTTMIVNRGMGNSGFPVRFGNRPEVGVITLKRE